MTILLQNDFKQIAADIKLSHSIFYIIFCTMTNKCTIISQFITLLHVSTLSCHPQGACNQCLAKLTQALQMQLLVIQFTIKMFHIGFI
jgi:hypothetical protein